MTQADNFNPRRSVGTTIGLLVVKLAGSILLVASLLKAWTLCHGCPSICIARSCFATGFVGFCEGLVGTVIICYAREVWAKFVVIGTFAALAVVSAFHVAWGKQSCGCLGPVLVSPALLLVLDTTIVLVMLWFSVDMQRKTSHKWFIILCNIFVVVFALLALWSPAIPGTARGIKVVGAFVFLDPAEWQGQSATILQQLDPDLGMSESESTIVFLRGNCEDCLRAVDELSSTKQPYELRFVLLPPVQHLKQTIGNRYRIDVLSNENVWIAETPFAIEVNGEGTITTHTRLLDR